MVFCQFSNCNSVRDISNGLKSATGNLNHLGIIRAPSKSTVAYQNAHRDSNVFRDIFYALSRHFGQQAAWQRKGVRFKMPIKLLDSTLISLTMSVYDWAHYTTRKERSRCTHYWIMIAFSLISCILPTVKFPTIRRLMKLMSRRIVLLLPSVAFRSR